MAPNLAYVVDDQDPQIQYLCPVTKQSVAGSFFNNSWTSIADSSCSLGWFRYTFQGTQVRIVAPSSHSSQDYAVQIDDTPLIHPGGLGFWLSPVLNDGEHTVVFAAGNMSDYRAFDYLTVTAGDSTLLDNRTIIVDDVDFDYTGNWSLDRPASVTFDPTLPPYLNTTHWTNSVGDTLSFNFIGSSISVFGILPNLTSSENLTAAYIVDGKSTTVSLPPSDNMVSPMTQFFHADLQPGSHHILINITSVSTRQPIGFDFALYNSTSTSSFTTVPAGASVSDQSSNKAGLIVGASLGAVFGLLLILLLLFLLRWKKQQQRPTDSEWTVVSFKDGEKIAQEAYTPPVLPKDVNTNSVPLA